MRWSDVATDNCTVSSTLRVVGNRWALLVLREAFNGVRRFDEVQRHLGIAPAVLTKHLDTLVSHGLLEQVPYQEVGQRTRYEYHPTEMGWDLYPVVIALMNFGDKHLAGPEGPPVELYHRDCDQPVGVRVSCGCGHDVDYPRDVRVAFTASARPIARP